MSKLSKAQRDKLPASAFALPGQRLYPVLDQSDVDGAVDLVGKHPEAKAGIIRRVKELGLKLPDAWQPASMSADGAMVIKRGKIFEAGDYPGQRFSLTPEEMHVAAATYTPGSARVRDTHFARETSLLDGRLGHVERLSLDPANPYDLIADVAIPQWLDEALGDVELSVSAEWNRQEKQLEALAFLTNPLIEDAVLVAAFARATAGQAQPAQQPQAGAPGAQGTVVRFSTAEQRRPRMSFGERFKAWFTGGMVGEPPEPDPVQPAAAGAGSPAAAPATTPAPATPAAFSAAPGTDPVIAALQAKAAAQDKVIEELTEARILAEAVAFADAEIAAHRAMPAEREGMIAEFSQATRDDARTPAQFGNGKSRVTVVRERQAARPAHGLTQQTANLTPEQIAAFAAGTLVNPMTTPQAAAATPMTPERRQELLAATPVGQAVLEQRRNGQSRN